MAITNAQIAQKILDMVEARIQFDLEHHEWLTGVVGGGDFSDGKYLLTNPITLVSRYTTSPAQLEEDVDGLVSSAAVSASNAATSEANAATSESNSGINVTLAIAEKDASVAAKVSAENAQSAAENAAVTAIAQAGAALASANAAALSETNAAASETQTGLDAVATAADRVQTGLDVIAAAASAAAALVSENNAAATVAAALVDYSTTAQADAAVAATLTAYSTTAVADAAVAATLTAYSTTAVADAAVAATLTAYSTTAQADALYLALTGGTLTGALTINRTTTNILTLSGSQTGYVNAAMRLISNQADNARGLGVYAYSANSDVEYFSGRGYSNNDQWEILRATGNVGASDATADAAHVNTTQLLALSSAGNLSVLGTVSGSNLAVANWNTAFGWGDHDGLYLPVAGTAANSTLLGGVAESEAATVSTIAKRTAAGYLLASYFNMSGGNEATTAGSYAYFNTTDGYIRRKTLANVKTEIVTAAAVNAVKAAPTAAEVNAVATEASTVSTAVKRNGSGDINARLFRSEYDTTNGTVGYIMTQIDTATNNYLRPTTPAQFRTAVNAGYLGAAAYTVSTAAPSGGADGDFWFVREA